MKMKSIFYVALVFIGAILSSCGDDDGGTVVIPPAPSSTDGVYRKSTTSIPGYLETSNVKKLSSTLMFGTNFAIVYVYRF